MAEVAEALLRVKQLRTSLEEALKVQGILNE